MIYLNLEELMLIGTRTLGSVEVRDVGLLESALAPLDTSKPSERNWLSMSSWSIKSACIMTLILVRGAGD